MILTNHQKTAVDVAVDAIRSGRRLFRIGGYAGTGKTTVLKEIVNQAPLAVCAYTGKAASVLRKKGVDATTIHARIYRWVEELQEFQKVEKVGYTGFGIDEASMVGDDIYHDVESYGVPIIAVGDPGQLEPISSKEINLMKDPDIVLTEIHRQALGNPIIDLATRIRTGKEWGLQDEDERCVVTKQAEMWASLDWADVIICGYNKTRVAINQRKRKNLGYTQLLEEGDRIICLQNDRSLGIFNGLMFRVLKIRQTNKTYWRCDVESDDGVVRTSMPIWVGQFNKASAANWKVTRKFAGRAMVADYGYGITCHKSQGSEWEKVVVLNQAAEKLWNQTRWLYTGVTRASEYLRLFK
jgi:exodeoxyribonuclease-5